MYVPACIRREDGLANDLGNKSGQRIQEQQMESAHGASVAENIIQPTA